MLIDTHCHLPHAKYPIPVGTVIQEANDAGVEKLITIGTSLKDTAAALAVALEYACVYSTVGIYPHEELGVDLADLRVALEKQIRSSAKVVGIGECGIDISNWVGGRDLGEQKKLFEMQVELACEYKLPLSLHNRNGDASVLQVLNSVGGSGLRGVAHCFSSTWDFAKELLDMGFYISFSGSITYPSATNLLEIVKQVPLDRFVLETDSPYLPPEGHRGETNYPKYVTMVAEKVAQVKHKTLDVIARASYDNTCRLFSTL